MSVGEVPVRNWSGALRWAPQELAVPGTEEEVAALLAGASSDGITVRAVGAGHSFTPLAVTDGIGLSLDRQSRHTEGAVHHRIAAAMGASDRDATRVDLVDRPTD